MTPDPRSERKAITVANVALAAVFLAIVGADIQGFFTGSPGRMILGFTEWFVIGFIILYVVASFVELFRK
jgi:hypothetical protein